MVENGVQKFLDNVRWTDVAATPCAALPDSSVFSISSAQVSLLLFTPPKAHLPNPSIVLIESSMDLRFYDRLSSYYPL